MKPGYLVYEHRILVDLDDAEMLRLAERDILKGLEDDIEMGQLEANIEEIKLSQTEIKKYPGGNRGISTRIQEIKKELLEIHEDDEEDEDDEDSTL